MHNLQQLSVTLLDEWGRILNAIVFKYVWSMRHYVATLRRQQGGHTRY